MNKETDKKISKARKIDRVLRGICSCGLKPCIPRLHKERGGE